jgi:hypothetical protein
VRSAGTSDQKHSDGEHGDADPEGDPACPEDDGERTGLRTRASLFLAYDSRSLSHPAERSAGSNPRSLPDPRSRLANRKPGEQQRNAEKAAADAARDLYSEPWAARWEVLVRTRFGDSPTRADQRRRALVLALSKEPGGQAGVSEVTTLTPDLALAYDKKSTHALRGDIQRLYMMGLIEIPPLRRGIARVSAFELFDPPA